MAYWWILERKSFKDEPIKLTPEKGEAALQLWLRGDKKIFLSHLRMALDSSDIKAIGPSTKVMREENVYRLPSGLEDIGELQPFGKGKPIFAPDYKERGIFYKGAVICNWYKKNIDRREWDSYYSASPGYYRLDGNDGSVWIAMLVPEEENADKPDFLILCDKNEIKHLNRKREG